MRGKREKTERKIRAFKAELCLISGLFLILGCSCLPSVETKQAKAYEAQFLTLQAELEAKILAVIEKDWKFELLRVEKISDLSPEKIKALLPRGIRFSDEEIKAIFFEPGE